MNCALAWRARLVSQDFPSSHALIAQNVLLCPTSTSVRPAHVLPSSCLVPRFSSRLLPLPYLEAEFSSLLLNLQSCDSFVINRVQWEWQWFLSLYPRKESSFVFLADTLFWSSELQWRSPAMRLPSWRGHCEPSKEQSSCVCSQGASIMDVQLCWEFRKQRPQMTSGCDQRRASRQICSTLLSHKFTSDCFKLIHLG